ncbi:MAG: cupin domain-containing protein [Mucilaginibacter sp.]
MTEQIVNPIVHVTGDQLLERSRWYGPNLFTFLTTAEETQGAFSLIKCTLRKGFAPPPHIHTKEDESYFILDGEVQYEIGERVIHAKPGDYVHSPRLTAHTFKLLTDTATVLLLITPGGFEELFIRFSRPAQAMELPPVPTERPGKEFFENMDRLSTQLGVTTLPSL